MTVVDTRRPGAATGAAATARHLSRRGLAGLIAVGLVAAGVLVAAGASLLVAAVFGFAVHVAALGTASALVEGRRRATDRVAHLAIVGTVIVAAAPLVAVIAFTVGKGAATFTTRFLWHSMKGVGPLDAGGGAYHAILGTIEQVAIASVLSIPLGLLVAVYLVEYGRGVMATATRFFVDVMTGIPSIVAGLFIFAFWVLGLHRGFSGFAAGLALAVLMLPVVARSAEEMLKLVPDDLREASYALGVPRWRTIVSVVLPTASAGITTGVVLAVARVTGETAPLLLTAFGFDAIRRNPFSGPQSGLPLYVFAQAGSAFDVAVRRAWAGALTLILIVLVLTVVARLLTSRNRLAR